MVSYRGDPERSWAAWPGRRDRDARTVFRHRSGRRWAARACRPSWPTERAARW